MVKISNIFGDVYSGQAGEAGVFAKWKGIQYRRKYVKPANPRTVMQVKVRTSFANAVDLWHEFLSLQRLAYGYMATGLSMSGFNLLLGRWQKLTAAARAAYIRPHMGFKQVGSTPLTAIVATPTVAAQVVYTTAQTPLALGRTTYAVGTAGVDPWAIIDTNRGRVNIPLARTGTLRIDYRSLGRLITGETLITNPTAGAVVYTRFFPIDRDSVELYDGTVIRDALEVDIIAGRFRFTNTAPTNTSGSIGGMTYTPIQHARYETRRVDTNFVTWRAHSTVHGIVENAQTSEDGNRDIEWTFSGRQPVLRANISPLAAAEDEYIQMIA